MKFYRYQKNIFLFRTYKSRKISFLSVRFPVFMYKLSMELPIITNFCAFYRYSLNRICLI